MSRTEIINAPSEIWLVYGDIEGEGEGEGEVRHEECAEVCWSEEQQWPHDVRYVRADIANIGPSFSEDSSLEKWFPLTAKEVAESRKELRDRRAELAAARASVLGDAP